MAKKSAKPTVAEPKQNSSPEERAAIERARAKKASGLAPRLKIQDKKISIDHADPTVGWLLLRDALGSSDSDFLNVILKQLANASAKGGHVDEEDLNFMVSVVKGIEPRDQIETMLAAQMAGIHNTIMTFTRRLANAENIPQQDSAERALNKLARTFVSQMEALKRYRTGGEQKVTVQHVSVSEGGQAIVGNVTQTPREAADNPSSSPPALSHSQTPAMKVVCEGEPSTVPLKRKPNK
ncbi:MAG TPA: hypothetical protein VNY08_18735 [Bradyrhizobium sp.]|jgi:hypothetical protein|nr:hypothetical protein [Bradyrhizobium sp.]